MVSDIFCQQFGGYMSIGGVNAPFGRRVGKCSISEIYTYISRICIVFRKKNIAQNRHLQIAINPPIVGTTYPITTKKIQLQNFLQCEYLYWIYSAKTYAVFVFYFCCIAVFVTLGGKHFEPYFATPTLSVQFIQSGHLTSHSNSSKFI